VTNKHCAHNYDPGNTFYAYMPYFLHNHIAFDKLYTVARQSNQKSRWQY